MKLIRVVIFISLLALLLWHGNEAIHLLAESSQLSLTQILILVCLIYALLLAVPFVPGMELGLYIMATFGAPGIVGAWLATVVGLNLVFWVGRFLAHQPTVRNLRAGLLRFSRSQRHRSNLLARSYHFVSGHPYLLLAFLFNVPGNVVFGGGGGISLISGAGGQLRWEKFFLVSAIATSGIPLLIGFGMVMLD